MTWSHNYYVYILTNWNNKVMYVGMTNDLERRIAEHKTKAIPGFTRRYNVTKLVYYEHMTDVLQAIAREKEIKKWRREKKNRLVESMNPNWKELSVAASLMRARLRFLPFGRNDTCGRGRGPEPSIFVISRSEGPKGRATRNLDNAMVRFLAPAYIAIRRAGRSK